MTSFNDSAWPRGPSQLGYGDGDEETNIGFIDTDPNTNGDQKNATSYFRKAVTISDPAAFENFTLDITFDDTYAVYVNGKQIARHSGLAANAAYDTYASNTVGDNASETLTISPNAFNAGSNTLAVEIRKRARQVRTSAT